MKVLYFDCFTGASGDMILSALLDLGLGVDFLQQLSSLLGLEGVEFKVEKVKKQGITATSLSILAPKRGHSLSYKEIRQILMDAQLKKEVKEKSLHILNRIASAEAHIHGIDIEEVHFHELGGVDTVIDIAGSVAGIEELGVKNIFSSPLPISYGWIEIEHGIFPIPAPATMKLLEGVPIRRVNIEGETLTPTGAGIITSLAQSYELPPMRLTKVGLGAGKHDFPLPNVLRVLLGESIPPLPKEEVCLLETNIDDMPPNLYEHVMEKLFQEGALDVFLQPIIMKRSRPAVILSVLCNLQDADALARVIFQETSTLGVRYRRFERAFLEREIVKISTRWGEAEVKIAKLEGKILTFSPELRSCEDIAKRQGIPLKSVIEEVKRAFQQSMEKIL